MELKAGYKQTEVGVIPEDWEVMPFSKVTNAITCGVAATPKYVSEHHGKPFLSASHVQNGKVITDDFKFITIELYNQITKNNKPEKGDILYTRVGAGIGEAGVIEVDFDFAIYVSLTLIKPKKYLNSYFLKSLLNSNFYRFLANRDQFAGGGVQNLNVQVVKEFPIPVPSLLEQAAIARALSDVDALISALNSEIAKKRLIKQGAMQELLSGKKRLTGFSGEWEVKKLGDITVVATGNTPPTNDKSNYGDEYLFVSPVDLGNGKYILNTEKKLSKKGFDISRKFPKNSILFTCIGSTIGKSGIASFELTSNQQINAVFPNESFSSDFLFYALNKLSLKIKSLASEQAVPLINKTDFEANIIPLPPTKEEQNAIAQILSDMDNDILALETQRNKTLAIKQGMMQNLLTGKIRLI